MSAAPQLSLDLTTRVNRMVVIACTKAKLDRPASPLRLYTGVTWSTWRRYGPPDGSMPNGWSLWALSAEHGLIESWRTVEPYDTRLTEASLEAFAARLAASWRAQVAVRHHRSPKAPTEAVIVGGDLYQRAATAAGLPVVARIDGSAASGRGGIGLLRKRTERFAAAVRREMGAWPGDAAAAWPGDAWAPVEGAER